MLSVSYVGKTCGVLRGGASGANRCYVLAHCAPPPKEEEEKTDNLKKEEEPKNEFNLKIVGVDDIFCVKLPFTRLSRFMSLCTI